MTWFGNSDEIPMIHRENPRMGKLTFQDRLTINRGIMDGPNGPIEDMMLGEYTDSDREMMANHRVNTGKNYVSAGVHRLGQTSVLVGIFSLVWINTYRQSKAMRR